MSRRLLPRALLFLCLFGVAVPAFAAAQGQTEGQSLVALISRLQERGHAIIYSDRLVLNSMRTEGLAVDIATLLRSLEVNGLRLQKQGDVWIVSPGQPPQPRTAATTVAIESVLETVIVTGSVHSFPEPDLAGTSYRLLPDEMSQIPSLGSDVMRAMVRMPGISSVGVSAKPRIRGGLQDELLVLQDGVELLEPFHLADYHSAYSAIDYHTIESVDFYTGGFPSRYGNRISGVMDINNEWSRDDYDTDVGLSSFSSFVNTRGESSGEMPTQWLLSYRQGDLEDLTDYIETRSGEPTYRDISARINIKLSADATLSSGVVASEDDIVFNDIEEGASSQIDSDYLWSRLELQLKPELATTLAFSYIDFERKKNEFSLDPVDEENPDPTKGGGLDHQQQVERLALRNDYTAIGSGRILEFGWQAEYAWSKYRHVSAINRGELADILGTEREVSRDIDIDPEGWSGGVYLAAELELSPRWLIQPSLRWDFQTYYRGGSEIQWSPRLGLAYELGQQSRLRLSLGRFYQPEGIHELQVLDGEIAFFKPQYADQAVLGIEWGDDKLHFTGELYYKRYRDVKTRYENVFNPFVLLPEMEPDRVQLSPEKTLARGIDLDIRYSFTEHWRGHLRYSAMNAEDKLNGQWVPRRWSQDETVNAILAWEKDTFNASIALVWHSGWYSSRMPELLPVGSQVPLESVLNNTELRDYFSLDISVRKSWVMRDSLLQVYADITNATDRDNIAGIDYDIEEVENGAGEVFAYALTPDQETLLSMVPSLGFIWSF